MPGSPQTDTNVGGASEETQRERRARVIAAANIEDDCDNGRGYGRRERAHVQPGRDRRDGFKLRLSGELGK